MDFPNLNIQISLTRHKLFYLITPIIKIAIKCQTFSSHSHQTAPLVHCLTSKQSKAKQSHYSFLSLSCSITLIILKKTSLIHKIYVYKTHSLLSYFLTSHFLPTPCFPSSSPPTFEQQFPVIAPPKQPPKPSKDA